MLIQILQCAFYIFFGYLLLFVLYSNSLLSAQSNLPDANLLQAALPEGPSECLVFRTSSSIYGPKYAELPDQLPIGVRVKDFDLYRNMLRSEDLQNVKLFIFADSNLEFGITVRNLSNVEIKLLQNSFKQGMDFSFAADNPTNDEASRGTRNVLNRLTDRIQYSAKLIFDSGLHTPNLDLYPFLEGVTFAFNTTGLNSPGWIDPLKKPATCITYGNSGKCRAAWLPEVSQGHGFIFVSANANIGSKVYLKNLIKKSCGLE